MTQIDHKDGDLLNNDIPNLVVKWTIEDCDTCSYWNESGYRNGLKAGYSLGRQCDHNEYQRQLYAHGYPRPAVMGCGTAELTSGFDLIRRALSGIRWQSADKDNMEFTARITYSQMDRIRTALYLSDNEVIVDHRADNDGLIERLGFLASTFEQMDNPSFVSICREAAVSVATLREYRNELRQMLEDVLDAFDPMIFGPMDWEENSKQAVVIERARGVLGHDQE